VTNFYYADLQEYDVTQRYKTVTVSQTTWLPVAIREHQVTLGRVQDFYYQISGLQLNVPFAVDLTGYTPQLSVQSNNPASIPSSVSAFPFILKSFGGDFLSLNAVRGKIVLLDFWEVWCGNCIESLTKVEALYKKFHRQGLEVYGITHDSAQIAPAVKLVQKLQLSYPNLIGTTETKIKYGINAFPIYVLIDRDGRIVMKVAGYSTKLETMIKELLTKEN